MNPNSAQTLIALRETFEARFQTILTAPMVSKSCSNHGVIAKTSSPCSNVCVSRVLSLPMVPSSVIRCKAQSDHVKRAVQFYFPHFYAQLSPVFCDKSHTVESESCASAIIMIVPKLRKFFGERLGSSLLCPTSVLLQLEVIKCPTMGYDLAWCGGTLTHSGTDAQTDVRFPADFQKTRMHLI